MKFFSRYFFWYLFISGGFTLCSMEEAPLKKNILSDELVASFLNKLKVTADKHVAEEVERSEAKRLKAREDKRAVEIARLRRIDVKRTAIQKKDLFLSVEHGLTEKFQQFFSNNVEVEGHSKPIGKLLYLRNDEGDTLLHYAIRFRRGRIVSEILDKFIGSSCCDQLCKYAFWRSESRGKDSLSKKILRNRINPLLNKKDAWLNGIANIEGETPYSLASRLLRECKERSASASAIVKSIRELDINFYSTVVTLLEEHEFKFFALVNEYDDNGNIQISEPPAIPLLGSCYQGNVPLTRALLKNGATVNAKNDNDRNLLSYLSVYYRGCREIYELLLDSDIDVNSQDSTGNTPLMNAILHGDLILLKLLLKRQDVNIELCNKNGENAIHIMAQVKTKGYERYEKIFKKLLGKVSNKKKNFLIQADNRGMTPLHHAVARGYFQTTMLLNKIRKMYGMEKLASIMDIRDHEGYSVLHRAINAGHAVVVSKCLAMGAPVKPILASGENNEISCQEIIFGAMNRDNDKDCKQISRMLEICTDLKDKRIKVGDVIDSATGNTMLHDAVINDDFHIVCLLVCLDADHEQENCKGQSPIDYAYQGSKCYELLHMLDLGDLALDELLRACYK